MNTLLTPCNIEVLLHFHCMACPHPMRGSLGVGNAISQLLADGAIEPVPPDLEPGFAPHEYQTTALGAAWVMALCQVEKPKLAYLDAQGKVLREA